MSQSPFNPHGSTPSFSILQCISGSKVRVWQKTVLFEHENSNDITKQSRAGNGLICLSESFSQHCLDVRQ